MTAPLGMLNGFGYEFDQPDVKLGVNTAATILANAAGESYADGKHFQQTYVPGIGAVYVNYAGAPVSYQNGIGFDVDTNLLTFDASLGLPADVFWQSGLPIKSAQNRLCLDPTNPVLYWHQGVPFALTGAVCVSVYNPA